MPEWVVFWSLLAASVGQGGLTRDHGDARDLRERADEDVGDAGPQVVAGRVAGGVQEG